ncbi:transcription elongation factor GreA [Glutamicibacter nicotianae]|uniref:transcription elongation factor GreA n=1 Tax=Glutamicibacter nicotianae TaxID=37929 RepID=UPI00167F3B3A|nr:transcription elongation factor GreA [Glutamicibacter nicotianae]
MSTNSNEPVVWLTQEAYDRLQDELTFLSGPGRAEIVARIEQARSEGDLKENGGYHAAREEQGKAEARILYLKDLLRRADVGEAPADDGVVEPGMLVVANIAGDETTFLFGSREVAGDTDLEVYSEQSPIGVAMHGAKVGDKLSYLAPNGRDIKVEIISAKPYQAS